MQDELSTSIDFVENQQPGTRLGRRNNEHRH
jgi:hypothetical protein